MSRTPVPVPGTRRVQRSDGYVISTDPAAIDLARVHTWLSTDAYWALGRSREVMERAVAHSLNFSVFAPDGQQVAYARVLTDHATFAWVCDVYVDRSLRGRGLGGWLVETVRDHLAPWALRRIVLTTLDAHSLYERVGFAPPVHPERWLTIERDAGQESSS